MKKVFATFGAVLWLSVSVFAQDAQLAKTLEEGRKLSSGGKYSEAASVYKKALSKDKNNDALNNEMALVQLSLKNYSEAITFADKVITANSKLANQAFATKGSAQGLKGDYDQAVLTFKDGINKYPEDFYLYYNLAFTQLNGSQYAQAEASAKKAVLLKPDFAGSHLVLGQTMYYQNKRVQAMLALYYFLMLEPNTPRSSSALAMMDQAVNLGITKEGDKINVQIPNNEKDEFGTADVIISLSQANKYDEKNKSKSEQQVFCESTKMLFNTLVENNKGDKKDIWWSFYVPFFDDMQKNDNVDAFCYQALSTKSNNNVQNWVRDNKSKIDKLNSWYEANYAKK
ncbi:MAG: tetratricopeptide repeat protein [Flavipsychrobacter sp.]|nr:tetratricopeptide repeat protein [Flavipsychrobacter sp.]